MELQNTKDKEKNPKRSYLKGLTIIRTVGFSVSTAEAKDSRIFSRENNGQPGIAYSEKKIKNKCEITTSLD